MSSTGVPLRQQKNFSKSSSPKFPPLRTAKLEQNSGKTIMKRFCRGTPANCTVAFQPEVDEILATVRHDITAVSRCDDMQIEHVNVER